MKKAYIGLTVLLLVGVLYFANFLFGEPIRTRLLLRKFDRVKVGMTEKEVIEIMGSSGHDQSCSGIPKGNCDHERVIHLAFPDFLTVEFDSQGRVTEKWRSP